MRLLIGRRAAIFVDYPVPELTLAEVRAGRKAARSAAIRAQNSWTLRKGRLYRDYRAGAGDRFLDWPRWLDAYLDEYRDVGPTGGPSYGFAAGTTSVPPH